MVLNIKNHSLFLYLKEHFAYIMLLKIVICIALRSVRTIIPYFSSERVPFWQANKVLSILSCFGDKVGLNA